MSSNPGARSDLVSLSERMTYLQGLRICLAIVAVVFSFYARSTIDLDMSTIVVGSSLYLTLVIGAQLARWMSRGRIATRQTAGMMLIADGLFIGWATFATGDAISPLRFMVYLHLIAVTLLASYRTGVKVALWDSLVIYAGYWALSNGFFGPERIDPQLNRMWMFMGAFWLVVAATALFSSINERQLRRGKHEAESFSRLAQDLETEEEVDAIAHKLVTQTAEAFGCKRIAVFALEDDAVSLLHGMRLDNTVARREPDAQMKRSWDKREPLALTAVDPDANPVIASLMPGATHLLIFPLLAEGRPQGVMVVELRKGSMDRRTLRAMNQFAAHGSLALHSARLLKTIRRLAETDGLTGIANRRSFEETLTRELSRASRNGDDVSLALLDIDHFKSFNDDYGHQLGDDVLAQVAWAVSRACRDFDTAARYGGEEFAI
ncbi:MAG: sensor domain-containing diguanylate cyclase, partial [Actinomycetota bacterium]|nr:sensor domain-containing diguanylate cyclase [Actinomycetota bacterium]